MKSQQRCNDCQKGVVLLILLLLASCSKNHEVVPARTLIEHKFIDAGLVDIATIDETIEVDLVNSDRGKNIFRKNFYSGLQKAYLQKDVAFNLSKAQNILKSKHPGFSLLIMDAARPRSVSIEMYERVQGTRLEKFVADPGNGSMHNYGTAVDITIMDGSNKELDMGFSPFYMSKLRLTVQYMIHRGNKKLTEEQINNRQLLKEVMTAAGFIPLSIEWWHFIGMPKDAARAKYNIIE